MGNVENQEETVQIRLYKGCGKWNSEDGSLKGSRSGRCKGVLF